MSLTARILIAWLSLAAAGCAVVPPLRPEPEPRPAPTIEVLDTRLLAGAVHIEWQVRDGGTGLEFEVQRRHAEQPWKRRATLTADETGRLRIEDGAVSPGEPYTYGVLLVARSDRGLQGVVTVLVP
jgi:hypothetical protein